jgi:hypothetical protein
VRKRFDILLVKNTTIARQRVVKELLVQSVDLAGHLEQRMASLARGLGPDVVHLPTRSLLADDKICPDFGRLRRPGENARDWYVKHSPCKVHRRDLTCGHELRVTSDW